LKARKRAATRVMPLRAENEEAMLVSTRVATSRGSTIRMILARMPTPGSLAQRRLLVHSATGRV
jgi:hypothetical protein